ncbi:Uncharacterized conserved protein, DUF362 family [Methanococcoides vulcani]|uniref:Uncharacterized conserved protein, DUF362 family n=1 Tax=Methanococcoides vulcani TaxID=1353158 RepID=A0A1H9Y3Q8_9EURY|nr:DUF362 domain-containing protein [Methanococcoides vulcani]SES63441.1 Uncharacterized conserved protein, DUF362 family [Methanococcoides vulcani]
MGSGTQVSIVRCEDYSHAKEAVREAIDLIGGLGAIIFPGARVLLKPNLLAATPPEKAVTTHPAIVSAMCELVVEAGGIPIVGDGAGITHPGVTEEALEISGIREAAQKAGAEVLSFETSGYEVVDVPASSHFPKLYIAKPVLDADVVISLPKLKTHELTLYTGAVKNMFGAIPLKLRKEAHLLGKVDLFSEAVVDIYSARVPHLALMDGVVGMEGNGPARGTPVNVGIVMASYDCVSLDVVASKVIGLDPMDVPTNKAAIERGYGTPNPGVSGVPLDDVRMKFKLSGTTHVGRLPPFLVSRLGKLFTIKPFINTSQCTLCGTCVLNCSPHAIEQKDGRLKINHNKCILCYCCRELCPSGAVEMKRSLVAKLLLKIRNRD